jgi:F0F1-type ATP synthase epsilon subunit
MATPVSSELSLLMADPENTLFEGKIQSLSAINEKGVFEVFPGHIHFISLITDEVKIREKGRPEKIIRIKSALMKVIDNNIYILVGSEDI